MIVLQTPNSTSLASFAVSTIVSLRVFLPVDFVKRLFIAIPMTIYFVFVVIYYQHEIALGVLPPPTQAFHTGFGPYDAFDRWLVSFPLFIIFIGFFVNPIVNGVLGFINGITYSQQTDVVKRVQSDKMIEGDAEKFAQIQQRRLGLITYYIFFLVVVAVIGFFSHESVFVFSLADILGFAVLSAILFQISRWIDTLDEPKILTLFAVLLSIIAYGLQYVTH